MGNLKEIKLLSQFFPVIYDCITFVSSLICLFHKGDYEVTSFSIKHSVYLYYLYISYHKNVKCLNSLQKR